MQAEARLPRPHAGQVRVFEEARRINLLCAGRRWRKTTHGVHVAARTAAQGGTVVWGAPTSDQVETAFEELRRVFPTSVARMRSSPQFDVRIARAGRIMLRSLDDPDNARSKTADLVIVDEAADVIEAAWTEVLRPMLMDTKGGAWFLGTPKGRNWFARLYFQLTDPARADKSGRAWQVPSLGCRITSEGLVREPHHYENPTLDFEEIRALFEGDGAMSEMSFRQEILAEFVADAGGVFRNVRECCSLKRQSPRPGHFVLGVDWGKKHDFTVLALYEPRSRSFVDLDRFNQIDWHVQRKRLHGMVARWKAAGAHVEVVAEENSLGDGQIESLGRVEDGYAPLFVHRFETTQASKEAIIDHYAHLIETRKLKHLNDSVVIDEHESFEMTRLPSGRMRYGAATNAHDDVVMASAIAVHGAGKAAEPEDRVVGSTHFGVPAF